MIGNHLKEQAGFQILTLLPRGQQCGVIASMLHQRWPFTGIAGAHQDTETTMVLYAVCQCLRCSYKTPDKSSLSKGGFALGHSLRKDRASNDGEGRETGILGSW